MSDFNFSTTGSSVVERWGKALTGKTVVITGSSTGTLGGETAITLASSRPAQIILLARSEPKVRGVIESINAISPSTQCVFVPIELDDFDSVRTAALNIQRLVEGKVDVLINNAGVMAIPWAKNKTGIEKTFAINHLGHFLLTGLLMPLILAAGPGSRVVNLTSAGYKMGPFRREDWNFGDGETYHRLSAYAQSKTANVLFSVALAERYARHGVLSFAAHPGYIPGTSLVSHTTLDASEMDRVSLENTGFPFAADEPKSLEQGIATTLVAALSPDLAAHNGAYLADCQVEETRQYARDPELAEALWELSEELVGEGFKV
ncbi:hypothetical protein BDW62DRAFT_208986 [Aspergillus aurantiobrunneus]